VRWGREEERELMDGRGMERQTESEGRGKTMWDREWAIGVRLVGRKNRAKKDR
jgi:hypothetical protein